MTLSISAAGALREESTPKLTRNGGPLLADVRVPLGEERNDWPANVAHGAALGDGAAAR